LIDAAQEEKRALQEVLLSLKSADEETRNSILNSLSLEEDSSVLLPSPALTSAPGNNAHESLSSGSNPINDISPDNHRPYDTASTAEEKHIATFISRDESGAIRIFGPTSNLHDSSPGDHNLLDVTQNSVGRANTPNRYQLIASAALQRQREHDLRKREIIGGIPGELAMHLLDLHWNRQHHTYHLTYRPALMRDLADGGPYCSEFLLNAVFGCCSKFSERLEVRENPALPETAGKMFFDRCDELLSEQSLLETSSIPTITGLLLLGATFNAKGRTSKGWLYVGYALRMVYDLGLHLDCKEVSGNAEDVEIRRRVFWGAFICDKLQSLYFGRPYMIPLRDAHVSWDLMDTLEENEMWTPYVDPKTATQLGDSSKQQSAIRLYSITTFQQLCSLSQIMTTIIDHFYFVGANPESTRQYLSMMDEKLGLWYQNLPADLRFEPWTSSKYIPAPTIIILLTIYWALIILLHRPFIKNGHLWTANTSTGHSWERCVMAARNITSLSLAYQSAYSLRRANYMLSYALYVACTIHARNRVVRESTRRGDLSSPLTVCLRCLDELAVPNCGVSVPAKIIRRLMRANDIPDVSGI
jgi:Fungal specific transcription factor domain